MHRGDEQQAPLIDVQARAEVDAHPALACERAEEPAREEARTEHVELPDLVAARAARAEAQAEPVAVERDRLVGHEAVAQATEGALDAAEGPAARLGHGDAVAEPRRREAPAAPREELRVAALVDREVRAPADLAGLNLRTPSRTGAWVIEALGASPIAMPVPEVPAALSKKVAEATLLPWEIVPPLKLYNQIKYFIEGADNTRLGTTTFQVTMNQARWDGLPDDIKKAFSDASGRDWWGKVADVWRGGDDFGIKMATDNGSTHIMLTPEETAAFMDAVAPVQQRWIDEVTSSGIDGAALVAKARDLTAKNAQK